MKRILSIVTLVTVLLIGFQNCGGLAQLPVSLGGNSSIILSISSATSINFPFSWSTDTGNFDKRHMPTAKTAIIDLADSVCFLYEKQLKISNEECLKIVRLDPQFINLFHNLKEPYKSFEELESDSNSNLIDFNRIRGDSCLLYIDSNQIQISVSEADGVTKPEDDFIEGISQVYSVIALSDDCANTIHEATTTEGQ
jgi:hypothetical protein